MRYYFNIREGGTLIEDPDGEEFASPEAMRAEAVEAARELMATRLLSGQPMNGRKFEIIDEAGTLVGELLFRDAIPAG